MDETKYKNGFMSGFVQLQIKDKEPATKDLWVALVINNKESFRFYRDGKIEPKAGQAVAVENVFRKYGVTDNIWGE